MPTRPGSRGRSGSELARCACRAGDLAHRGTLATRRSRRLDRSRSPARRRPRRGRRSRSPRRCVALTFTRPARERRARARGARGSPRLCGPSFGRSMTSVQSTFTIAKPRSASIATTCASSSIESASRQRSSVSGKCSPMSPSAGRAEQRVDHRVRRARRRRSGRRARARSGSRRRRSPAAGPAASRWES